MHHKIVVICMLVVAIATTVVQSGNHGEQDEAVVALGRRLFYDPVLSVDQTTSCGTCHQQFAAFAHVDHALSHGVYGRMYRHFRILHLAVISCGTARLSTWTCRR